MGRMWFVPVDAKNRKILEKYVRLKISGLNRDEWRENGETGSYYRFFFE